MTDAERSLLAMEAEITAADREELVRLAKRVAELEADVTYLLQVQKDLMDQREDLLAGHVVDLQEVGGLRSRLTAEEALRAYWQGRCGRLEKEATAMRLRLLGAHIPVRPDDPVRPKEDS